jgi:hypothetical protein
LKNWLSFLAISGHGFVMIRRSQSDSLAAEIFVKKLAMRHIEGHIQ